MGRRGLRRPGHPRDPRRSSLCSDSGPGPTLPRRWSGCQGNAFTSKKVAQCPGFQGVGGGVLALGQ